LVAADVEKALLSTIATESATFVLLNIFLYLLVELRDFGRSLRPTLGSTVNAVVIIKHYTRDI
jgi:hypothetical protein